MSHSLYDQLIAVLDVFIDEFGGDLRLRGVQTLLLIHQATLDGRGISISEVRKVTGAPLENIRRHFTKQVEIGNLAITPDPDDDRVVRYRMPEGDDYLGIARRLSGRLALIGPPGGGSSSAEKRPFDTSTYDALIAALQAFANTMDGGLRIRGIKMAVVIQQATLDGSGMTASQIARQSGAPLETVRRYVQTYTEKGHLKLVEDPEDSRAHRILYTDPAQVERLLKTIASDLDAVDWSAFHLA